MHCFYKVNRLSKICSWHEQQGAFWTPYPWKYLFLEPEGVLFSCFYVLFSIWLHLTNFLRFCFKTWAWCFEILYGLSQIFKLCWSDSAMIWTRSYFNKSSLVNYSLNLAEMKDELLFDCREKRGHAGSSMVTSISQLLYHPSDLSLFLSAFTGRESA